MYLYCSLFLERTNFTYWVWILHKYPISFSSVENHIVNCKKIVWDSTKIVCNVYQRKIQLLKIDEFNIKDLIGNFLIITEFPMCWETKMLDSHIRMEFSICWQNNMLDFMILIVFSSCLLVFLFFNWISITSAVQFIRPTI